MTVSLFSVVKGGVALATATVGCSKDVLVFDGASNVGNVAVGCVETSVVVESPSADPSNAPPPVGTVAAVGVGTALTDQMFNLQGQIVVPPRSYAAITNVVVLLVVEFFYHLHMGDNALNLLHLAVRPITTRTLCQIRHMACLRLHHATDNVSRVGSHDGWWR